MVFILTANKLTDGIKHLCDVADSPAKRHFFLASFPRFSDLGVTLLAGRPHRLIATLHHPAEPIVQLLDFVTCGDGGDGWKLSAFLHIQLVTFLSRPVLDKLTYISYEKIRPSSDCDYGTMIVIF